MTQEKFIERQRDNFVMLEDALYVYFPDKSGGGYPSYLLRWIADELDRLNEPTQKYHDEYFKIGEQL